MPSEVENLKSILIYYFNIQASDIMFACAIVAIGVCAYLGLQRGFYQGMGAAFIALTFCTLLALIPPHLYAIMCILLAAIIAGKFFNFGSG